MESTDSIIIGVDGGGTACKAALCLGADAARFELRGGPANVSDFDAAILSISSTLTALAQSAGLGMADLEGASAHLGLAGVMSPALAVRVAVAVKAAVPLGRITVTDDQPTTVSGALGSGNGVVAAIGTGSFIGRQSGGAVRVLGGWGFLLGDQASGAYLGQRLLRAVMLAVDGIAPASDLTASVLAQFADDPARIVAFAVRAVPADFAALAPMVLKAALTGDPLAVTLMQGGADYIAKVATTLGWMEGEPLCLTGGIGPAYQPWLPSVMGGAVVAPRGSALDGALALAARAAGS